MKLTKMLGLFVAAAMAVMAFGASSASAAIDTCLGFTSNVSALTAAECTAHGGTIHTESSKITFTAKATNPILKGSLEEKCNESNTTTKTKGDGTPGIEVTALTFTGGCTPCPTVDTTPPYAGTIVHEGGSFFLKVPGSATLLGCFGFATCKFSSEAVTLKFVAGANHTNNEFRAEAEKLTGPGGLCGSTGTWTANYVVSSPSKFYPFLL